VFNLCALRSCGGTAVLVHGQGVVRVCNSAVGGMTGHSPAEYGLTATDESKCDVEWTSFQRCRLFGAQVLRQANGTVRDCAVQRCQLFGVSGFCSLDKLSR